MNLHLKPWILFIFCLSMAPLQAQNTEKFLNTKNGLLTLTKTGADHFAKLALKCIHQEYPNKMGHTMADAKELKTPKQWHPAFYGCYDWHSAVHGHWMLIRLMKMFPGMEQEPNIRAAIRQNITKENILAETAYFERKFGKSFERTYGWAWLLKLTEELYTWDDQDAKKWYNHLQPLVKVLIKRYQDFLPKQTYPIRTGVHPNTAFGLSFALDYARTVKNQSFEKLLIQRSKSYYGKDVNCPAIWEPGGNDFFSPCLLEAELMSKVLPQKTYENWLEKFLGKNLPPNYTTPAKVSDRTDPQIVHLDGLNLSRAWCLNSIVKALPAKLKISTTLSELAKQHIKATLPHIASGDYAGEHWLASFAVYALSPVDK
ncbi:MAG TPA: DUF2891 domain-containing protein [Microscillaceae bacterium]|nr:DUF2891 domain-containing protein [Microscillaceae bacterium]